MNDDFYIRLLGDTSRSPVQPKKNRVKDLPGAKAKLRRVVERSTEAVVKVSGGTRGAKHMKAHIDYISRNGNIDLENERGEIIDRKDRLREEAAEWAADLGKPRKNQRDTINIVLSMPADTDPRAVQIAAREFASQEFGKTHQYLMALHHPGNDPGTKQPHVHLTVKALGYDGSKLDPKKADLQEWREVWAERMRAQGYDVEATPRRARGVTQKAKSQPMYAMENRPERRGKSWVQEAKIRDVSAAMSGKEHTENPYKQRLTETHARIKKAWLAGAEALDKSALTEDRQLAARIRGFVAESMKAPRDERDKIQAQLTALLLAHRQKEAGHKAPQKKDTDKDQGR